MLRKFVVIFAAVVAISSQEIRLKRCNDCVLLSECSGAVYLVHYKKSSRTAGFIKSALCSSDREGGIPKVCCSEFPPGPLDTENHPNLSLLPEDCGEILGDKIVGGNKAKLFEFPWMVLISFHKGKSKKFVCGGTLINSRYVLTAAHCIDNATKIAGVRLGEYDYSTKELCSDDTCPIQDVAVTGIHIHPSYSKTSSLHHDIGLLRLKRPAKIQQKNIRPICLPVTQKLRDRILYGEQATVAGWGLTENVTFSSTLLKVVIPISSSEVCKANYDRDEKEDLTKKILCAGHLYKTSCDGDSGGPLMLEGKYNGNYKYIQYGVVSHGPRQCDSVSPSVYTDVTWFMKWILDTIKP